VIVRSFSNRGTGDERREELRLGFATLTGSPGLTFDPNVPATPVTQARVGAVTIDGVGGPLDISGHSWSLASAPGPGGGSKATLQPFVIQKALDAATPQLLKSSTSQVHTKKITVQLTRPGSAEVYATYVLTDVTVAAYEIAGGGRPVERLSLDAARLEATAVGADNSTVRQCWDVKLNASC
jgi:type VI protein secretion system component Hcp